MPFHETVDVPRQARRLNHKSVSSKTGRKTPGFFIRRCVMSDITKVLTIKSRGRKYFECAIGERHSAKLVINAVSEDLEAGTAIVVRVNDISESSRYGTVLKFEPLHIIEKGTPEEIRKSVDAYVSSEKQKRFGHRDAEKWLGYAENDIQRGYTRTNAIREALSRAPSYDDLADRLAALKDGIQKNIANPPSTTTNSSRSGWRASSALYSVYPVSAAPSLNETYLDHGKHIVFTSYGKNFRLDDDDECFLGYEGALACRCYYRYATDEEIAAFAEKEEAAKKRASDIKALKAEIDDLRNKIRAGEMPQMPQGSIVLQGENLLDTMNVYGGGEMFVIDDQWIWHVQNNGGDGDNWGVNNIRTGGAGAIGRRIPFDQTIADRLRALDAKAKELGTLKED